MGDLRGALEAYLEAMRESDPEDDCRWGAYLFAGEMAEVADANKAPFVNLFPEFYRRELTDNPRHLWIDEYHPGPLGHRIIAGMLSAAIRGVFLERERPGKRKGV